jgi:hypothetical protein
MNYCPRSGQTGHKPQTQKFSKNTNKIVFKFNLILIGLAAVTRRSTDGLISRCLTDNPSTLFGWGESGRKESWGRESTNLKKLSNVWMQEKSGRKEKYYVGPTKICFLPKVDGKYNHGCVLDEMTNISKKISNKFTHFKFFVLSHLIVFGWGYLCHFKLTHLSFLSLSLYFH